MSDKDGFDSKKRMGNAAIRGAGVNSPAMMEARKGFSDKKAAFEKARAEHKSSGPHKTALDAIKSPTFSKMHNARKALKDKRK